MNLNKVFLIGRLVSDPETRSTAGGQPVCSFRLATNRVWTDKVSGEKKEQTQYHNIVLWRRLAEIASQFLNKGSLAFIEGRVETRSWQDRDGNKRFKTEVIAERLQLGPRAAGRVMPGDRAFKEDEVGAPETTLASQEKIPIIEEDKDEEIDVKDIPL